MCDMHRGKVSGGWRVGLKKRGKDAGRETLSINCRCIHRTPWIFTSNTPKKGNWKWKLIPSTFKTLASYVREFSFKASHEYLPRHAAQTYNTLQSGLSVFATSRPLSTHADLLKLVMTCVREAEKTGDLFGLRLSWRHHRRLRQQKATWLRTLKIYGMMLFKLSSWIQLPF